jgi:integral membrane protein
VTSDMSETEREIGQIRRLELVLMLEAATLIAPIAVAVPLKHLAGWPLPVQLMGPVHGLAFLFYIWTVLQTAAGGSWWSIEITRLVFVAFIPFCGLFQHSLAAAKAP